MEIDKKTETMDKIEQKKLDVETFGDNSVYSQMNKNRGNRGGYRSN